MVRIACPCPSLSARIENHALNKFARTLKFVRCGLASAPLLPPPPIPLGRTSYQRLMFRLNGCNGVTPLEIQDQRPRRVFSCLPCANTAIQLVVRPQMHTHFAGCAGPAPQCFRNGIIKDFSSSPAATARPMSLSTETRRTHATTVYWGSLKSRFIASGCVDIRRWPGHRQTPEFRSTPGPAGDASIVDWCELV